MWMPHMPSSTMRCAGRQAVSAMPVRDAYAVRRRPRSISAIIMRAASSKMISASDISKHDIIGNAAPLMIMQPRRICLRGDSDDVFAGPKKPSLAATKLVMTMRQSSLKQLGLSATFIRIAISQKAYVPSLQYRGWRK